MFHGLFLCISGKVSEDKHHYMSSDHEDEFCTESNPLLHRVEKRSYLPSVQCSSEHVTEAIQAKVHCKPRPKVVRLPFPNDTSINQVSQLDDMSNLPLSALRTHNRDQRKACKLIIKLNSNITASCPLKENAWKCVVAARNYPRL